MSMRLEYCKLGEVIHITSGKECPPENKTENSSFPIRGATGIIGYSKKPLYERPIILVGRVGAGLLSGMSGILNRAENPCWPSDNTLVIIPKEEDDFDYIEYCLRYSEIYPYVSGSSQPLLTQTALKLLEIPWPSRETRRIIANNGRQIDQLLFMNKKIMNISQEIISALFRSWFIDFNPVKAKTEGRVPYGMSEETAKLFSNSFEASELGPIPTGWKWGQLGDCISVVGGGTPSTKNEAFWDGEYNWTSPKDLSNSNSIIMLDTERTITEAGLAKVSSGLLPVDTVLMSSRAPIGYLALTKIPVAINQGYIAIPPKSSMSPNFMLSWIHFNMPLIEAYSSGSTFAEISKKEFRKLPILIPPAELIEKFNEKTTRLYDSMEMSLKQMNSLISTRDALLPRLMSGELSVS